MFSIESEALMNKSLVHVTLEIADHEIRLAIGQFHNTRLNIFKVERVVTHGVQGSMIVDQASVIKAIEAAKQHCLDTLGFPIERVVLAIPSINTARYSRRIDVNIQDQVTLKDIQAVLKEAYKTAVPKHQEIVNVMIQKSIVNGITLRRLPIGEVCNRISVDIDLLCADRDLVYKYVQTVEKAGLDIVDIALESYAFAKEASLFEKSFENYIVALKVERQSTSLSLYAKGKLASSEVLDIGMADLISEIAYKMNLPVDVADRLLHHNLRLGLDHYPDTPIYLWSSEGKTQTLSEKEMAQIIEPKLHVWLEALISSMGPILEKSKIQILLYGGSSDINGLSEVMAKATKMETVTYMPDTLGIRSSALSTIAGLFYVIKDQSHFRQFESGVNLIRMDELLNPRFEKSGEDTLSQRLKGLFEKRN